MRNLKQLLTILLCTVAANTHLHAQKPTVETDTRFVRGATMAFGRIKAASSNGGKDIKTYGFCYAEHNNPTKEDNVNQSTLSNNGAIYWMKDLKPGTTYYMRAYVVNQDDEVAYGEVIKFHTVPKGNVTFNLRDAGDEATQTRIRNAATAACEYYNAMTSASRHFDIGYGSGTETADCKYQPVPWMNVGPKQSYQRTGTIMHEMMHGLGLVNYSTQWSKGNLRAGFNTGDWIGERTTAAIRFWDNTTDGYLHGDAIHMWPYGVNGAGEDNGSTLLYLGNAMLCQALGEDGLEHNESRHADPYYAFEQDDQTKYYLKNESKDCGLYASYLGVNESGKLIQKNANAAEIQENDSLAWYITFTPDNQYYQFRNAATGQYLSFNVIFKTVECTEPSDTEDLQLMKGRIDVGLGANAKRGYWIIHPESNWTPKCLTGTSTGGVSSQNFNIANTAQAQRWMILTAEEAGGFESSALEVLKEEVRDLVKDIKPLKDVPHTENNEGADEAFNSTLNNIEELLESATEAGSISQLTNDAEQAVYQFLNNTTPIEITQPFDITYKIQNAGMDSAEGWSEAPAINYSCAEFYEKTFNINQILKNMPPGTYQMKVQGFHRPGKYEAAYNDYVNGTNNVSVNIYMGNKFKKIAHIAADAQSKQTATGEKLVNGKYIPDNMASASGYFAKGLYENFIFCNKEKSSDKTLQLGIRTTNMQGSYWCCFDNFRLYFYGGLNEETIKTNIDNETNQPKSVNVYSLDGRLIRRNATSLDGVKRGIYIVNGQKVVVK